MNTADWIAIGCLSVAVPAVFFNVYCTKQLKRLRALFVKPVPMTCDNCGVEFPPHPQATVEMHLKLRGPDDVPADVIKDIMSRTGMTHPEMGSLLAGEEVVLYKLCCQRCQLRMFLLNIREGRPV